VPASGLLKIMQGQAAKTYTVQMDIKVSSVAGYNSLFQTSLTNGDDGDIFINSGKIGVADLGYGGSIIANTWHRVVFVNENGHFHLYVDGTEVNDAIGTRWNLAADGFYLFTDDDGETKEIEVAEVAYWNKALTQNQLNNLGVVEVDNFLNIPTPTVSVVDDELDFEVCVVGNVASSFELPEWIEAVDVTPVIGRKNYTFRAKAMEGYGTREGEIIVKGEGVENQTVAVSQTRYQGLPEATGKWTFEDEDNLLSGSGVAVVIAAKELSTGITTYTNPGDIGIETTDGPAQDNKAIVMPKGSYLKLKTNTVDETLSSYTLMYDVKPEALSGYQSLLQTNTSNSGDGDLFIKDTSVGVNSSGLGYNGTLKAGKWHRIVFVVKDNYATLYLDGKKIGASTSDSQSHWEIENSALLFADNDGEEGTMDVAELRFWNISLTDKQVETLGAIQQ